jgi:hypothetical protein
LLVFFVRVLIRRLYLFQRGCYFREDVRFTEDPTARQGNVGIARKVFSRGSHLAHIINTKL